MTKRNELKQVKMTEEVRQKLYGFSISSGSIAIDYKLEIDDIPDEFIPIIKIKTLTMAEVDVMKMADQSDEDYYNDVIRKHIIGWKNLYDIFTGDEVKFKGNFEDGCDSDLYSLLPTKLKLSILQYLTKMSIV
jgi:hypothetical protein